jgi:3-oxoacyl-[acyl-carrier protein] reductase
VSSPAGASGTTEGTGSQSAEPAPMVRFDFSGKAVIVTGSGGGIGQAYAEALAAAGASVMVADIAEEKAADVATAIRASGGVADSVRVDVADPDSARSLAAATVERFGGIDYLVNNAAIFGGMQLDLLLTVDWEYLNRFLSVNMLGALNCVRACYPAMKDGGGGAIVNQSSTAAYLYAGFYGLAKAGVNSLTQQLAHELGGQHIRINAIAPGPIDTEASRTVVPDAFMKPILASLALKRQGETSDLVGMCLFLLSDEASWITGHVFNVDGGQVVRP